MKNCTLLLKSFLILCLYLPSFLLYSQKVPVIETDIVNNFSFTDKQLALESELSDLIKKYEKEYYNSDLKENIPKKDINRIEYLSGKLQHAGDGTYIWNTQYPGCSWYCGGYHFQTVSSSLPNKGNNKYDSSCIFDDDVRTAWVEGVKGYGIGEYIDVHFPVANLAQATDCYIVNGYNKNETTWKNNSRVKTMNLYIDERLVAVLNLKDTRDEQHFVLPHIIPSRTDTAGFTIIERDEMEYTVSTLRFLITDVYKGKKYDDTAISELCFDGVGVHCIAEGSSVSMYDGRDLLIQDVKENDLVLSYNVTTSTYEGQKVKKVHKVKHKALFNVILENGSKITITADHPFWNGEGWSSVNPVLTKRYPRYTNQIVLDMKEGARIMTKEGMVAIKKNRGGFKRIYYIYIRFGARSCFCG